MSITTLYIKRRERDIDKHDDEKTQINFIWTSRWTCERAKKKVYEEIKNIYCTISCIAVYSINIVREKKIAGLKTRTWEIDLSHLDETKWTVCYVSTQHIHLAIHIILLRP